VQAFQAAGCTAKVRFCNWFSKAVCGGEVDPLLTYFTDEELVSLNDKVNIKNNKYWLADNHKKIIRVGHYMTVLEELSLIQE
jgi:hypothetical protein